ncbi:MAG: hypothetical protein FWE14_08760 [Lachnospiraceae bacterium]|nr:hypothetical protein [Lachnospiraceae bacterium]
MEYQCKNILLPDYQTIIPDFNINGIQKFKISMENLHLNSRGRIYKVQKLDSSYVRTVEAKLDDVLIFTDYKWEDITFKSKVPKTSTNSIKWTFAKDKGFKSHILLSYNKNDIDTPNKQHLKDEYFQRCFNSIADNYSDFPAMPSSYLVIMQTLDIVTFETYLSYVYMKIGQTWKLNETSVIKPSIKEAEGCNIDFGMYSNQSFFKGNKLKLKFMGYGKTKDEKCAIFDYHCDNSIVNMQDKINSNIKREGTSYYHGQLWINLKTNDLERGTMFESYYAIQEGKIDTKINIRRKVICETVKEFDINNG